LAPGFHELRQTPLTKEQEIKGALASEEGAEPSGGTPWNTFKNIKHGKSLD